MVRSIDARQAMLSRRRIADRRCRVGGRGVARRVRWEQCDRYACREADHRSRDYRCRARRNERLPRLRPLPRGDHDTGPATAATGGSPVAAASPATTGAATTGAPATLPGKQGGKLVWALETRPGESDPVRWRLDLQHVGQGVHLRFAPRVGQRPEGDPRRSRNRMSSRTTRPTSSICARASSSTMARNWTRRTCSTPSTRCKEPPAPGIKWQWFAYTASRWWTRYTAKLTLPKAGPDRARHPRLVALHADYREGRPSRRSMSTARQSARGRTNWSSSCRMTASF